MNKWMQSIARLSEDSRNRYRLNSVLEDKYICGWEHRLHRCTGGQEWAYTTCLTIKLLKWWPHPVPSVHQIIFADFPQRLSPDSLPLYPLSTTICSHLFFPAKIHSKPIVLPRLPTLCGLPIKKVRGPTIKNTREINLIEGETKTWNVMFNLPTSFRYVSGI